MSKQEIIDKFRGVVRLNEALGAIRGPNTSFTYLHIADLKS
jgi:hypothetical protein